VTGLSAARASGYDYATVAYDAVTGAQVWLRRYRGHGYNSTSGAQVWASRYNGPYGDLDYPTAVAVSPATGTIFVTGESRGATSD